MKPMLLTAADELPSGKDWVFETKYDGFRCILNWDEDGISLISRNGKSLNEMYPEILLFCEEIKSQMLPFLPLSLDGEIVYLVNDYKSEFSKVQTRGRMRNRDVIDQHVQKFPCHYVVFDLLKIQGEEQATDSLTKRKTSLKKLFKQLGLPLKVDYLNQIKLQLVEVFTDSERLWPFVVNYGGEGVVAKSKRSIYENGKRTDRWLKVKNWRIITVALTKYDKVNSYFFGAVNKEGQWIEIVNFLHGMSDEEVKTLATLFQQNGKKTSSSIWELEPSICANVGCIDFDGTHMREPRFQSFNFEKGPLDCTWETLQRQLYPIPERVEVTHPDKPIWPEIGYTKDDYLLYLQKISSYMLPFLKDRLLTVIRYPHGVTGDVERFFQKHAPDYSPEFIQTKLVEDINYILCNDIESLLWLGNQLALEFHIPFQTIHTERPTEIVFDLDPPSVQEFTLAIEAGLRLKAILDQFGLHSFVKTSGGKGLQVYIPLTMDSFTYDETGIFTKFVCDFLVEQEPQWFTTERLKKNRGNKLYLDYVQHKEGKTIIAPYSPRGNEGGLVATPLKWEEVNSNLRPGQFPVPAVLDRVRTMGNLFKDFDYVKEKQPFGDVLDQLKEIVKHG
ncbi:DNA ligase D [Chungangia koreensis]|uniref:DNA ligase (ATP) n=1 Tax=Chungangia koreensis TaxID=752657 RepID=A0ABV8X396_9LACT